MAIISSQVRSMMIIISARPTPLRGVRVCGLLVPNSPEPTRSRMIISAGASLSMEAPRSLVQIWMMAQQSTKARRSSIFAILSGLNRQNLCPPTVPWTISSASALALVATPRSLVRSGQIAHEERRTFLPEQARFGHNSRN